MRDNQFVDTNIFLYAFSTKDKDKHSIAKKIILDNSIISTQVINETSSNLIKKLNFTEMQIKKFIESAYKRYEVINFSKDIFLTASFIREKYKYSYHILFTYS